MDTCKLKYKNSAFTLAEVLITLLVIGVIASLTITVVQQIQYAEMRAAFKKIYSDFEGATKRLMLDNGGTMKGLLAVSHTGFT